MKKYIMADILKPGYGDCSNGGITHRFDHVLIECEDGPIEREEEPENALRLIERKTPAGTFLQLFPLDAEKKWYMFGGCFAYSSDSRFNRISGGAPLQIMDRYEN